MRRLSRRRAMGRGRDGEGLVRADEVAAGIPRDPRRPGAGHDRREPLRRPRLLTAGVRGAEGRASRGAEALGFDGVRRHAAGRDGDGGRAPATLRRGGPSRHMDWMATTAERRRSPAALWPEVRIGRHARHELRARTSDPLGDAGPARPRRHLGLCPRPRLPRRHQGQAEAAGRAGSRRERRPTSRSSSTRRR